MRPVRWLLVTAEFPWPLDHGTNLRVYPLVRELCALGDSVSLLSYQPCSSGRKAYERIGGTITAITRPDADVPGSVRSGVCQAHLYDPNLAAHVSAMAGDHDVTVLFRNATLHYAQSARTCGRVVCDYIDDLLGEDIASVRNHRWSATGLKHSYRLFRERLYEQRYCRHADLVTFVTDEDASRFHHRNPSARVYALPNGIDVDAFMPPDLWQRNVSSPGIGFLGKMSHPPNEDAALFLLERIAPLIWREIPECTFVLIGDQPSRRILDHAGPQVIVTGRVDDVRPHLWDTTLMLIPMRSGTGIKNKILESWAASRATVATPLACHGLPVENGSNILLGKTAEELAVQAVRVLKDDTLREHVERSALETARRLSWSDVARTLRTIAVPGSVYRQTESGLATATAM